MLKLNWYLTIFSLVLFSAVSSCCCCDDDDDGACPDLIVEGIDEVGVDCPTGGGSCVTTVTFTVSNVGAGDAGAFNVRIVLDPNGSVVVNEFVNGGLDAGDSLSITIASPPGGNCFDPDCTVSITVDSSDAVLECNENNNNLTQTGIG